MAAVRTMILVFLPSPAAESSRIASMPGMRGMFRSSSKMSGCNCFVWATASLAVGGFPDHFQLRFGLQQATKPIAKDGVVIRDNDANRRNLAIHRIRTLSEEP